MRGTTKLGATLAGLSTAILVGVACVPPPPPPPPPGSTTTTTSRPLPNTPDGDTFLAGKPAQGKIYDGDASRVQISGDGNWVVYHHGAENLEITNRPPATCPKPPRTDTQIYRTDLRNGLTELVSKGLDGCYANGESTHPDINDNGQFVVYSSKGTNLVAGDTSARLDIFVKDMSPGGQTSVVSVAQGGANANGDSNRPDITDDGSVVVFNSRASNLVTGDNNNESDCFLKQLVPSAPMQRVSLGVNGGELDGFTYRCQIDGQGRKVVFDSQATNVLSTSLSKTFRVYLRDLQVRTTSLVSRRYDGSPAGAVRPDISNNGQCVAFQSTDANIVRGDTDTETDVFLNDLVSQETKIISVARDGTQVSSASNRLVVNADCTKVAFVSNSSKLVPEDRNGTRDVFMRDLRSNSLFILSVNSDERQGYSCPEDPSTTTTTTTTTDPGGHDTTGADDISTRPSISDDGLVIAFISDVCGLVPEEPQMAGYDGVIVRSFR